MANLDKHSDWDKTIIQDNKSATYTLNTNRKFVDRDISITVQAKDATLESSIVDVHNAILSNTNTSGVSVSGGVILSNSGWVSSSQTGSTQYVKGITLDNSKEFTVDDGIYNWTITKDADGNVYIV